MGRRRKQRENGLLKGGLEGGDGVLPATART